MAQQNSFDISGLDDGAEEKLDIPRNQYFNERDNEIRDNNNFDDPDQPMRKTTILRFFSILSLLTALGLLIAAGVTSKMSYATPGAVCLGLFLVLFLAIPFVDYRSSRKMLSYLDRKKSNTQRQKEVKQENLSEQISIGGKINKRAKYNKYDYYKNNDAYRAFS